MQAKVNAAMLAAQRFEAEGRWRKAADKYAEALQLMPDNTQAAAGYRKAAGLLDERPMLRSGGSSVGAVQMELQEQRERTIIEFNDACFVPACLQCGLDLGRGITRYFCFCGRASGKNGDE